MSVLRFEPFGDPFRQLDRMAHQMMSGTRTPMGMPMDVWHADDGYHVALDLPGVDPGSVEITTERGMLTIRAERRPDYGEGHEVLVAERSQGSFTRQLQLGDELDVENVRAGYRDGVLSLLIPVAQKAQPRRIEIQHDGGAQRLDLTSERGDVVSGSVTSGSATGGSATNGSAERRDPSQLASSSS